MRALFLALAITAFGASAQAQELTPERAAFRAIYEELVEIDSSPTTGSCTRAAEAMLAHLRGAGFSEADARVIVPEDRPDDGNLVAVLRGSSRRAMLLLAHIDVVDARREDWERDPFTLVEENGFFYGRGTADDKAMAAVFVDMFVRMRRQNYRPRRTIKLALTCGEETSNRVNGVDYLLRNHRDWMQAEFAINEGAGGVLGPDGRPQVFNVQAGEKIHQVMSLTVVNPGGHSSRPVPDNAIYRLSRGLDRLSAYSFPVELNPVTRAFFERMAPIVGGDTGAAMAVIARNPNDAEAAAVLARDPSYNAMMRTTCVATQLDAGHAPNALPQRATATLSCRVLQGHTPEEVQAELRRVLADEQIQVEIVRRRDGSRPPQLTRAIMGPVEQTVARMWPGTPIVPVMTVGATDGRFLNNAGIPTYGMSGMFSAPGESNAHGLNEKMRVRSLYEGRDFLDTIVRAYAAR
ncbi:MAG TPA: M20/M25/M40 family metallo-hydrolase [Vitreimonas sp.]|uniref:M20/M25/M40 family metallo-hydrolase n=1 Tax=Vitreimonas sp. TaxID=3069702 RepID=UPI002D5E1A82|nr:M20/M25/M40 family metallo-hydrolase [Vitreimonas sp.]HYD86402.1 M20/M25/M40 family metallo-hydrolase [Vitreimonas sp.]